MQQETLRGLADPRPRALVEGRKRKRPATLPTRSVALRGREVLEEEEYISGLESIISRSFFPDVTSLKAQLAWLHAVAPSDARMACKILRERADGQEDDPDNLETLSLKTALEEVKDVAKEAEGGGWQMSLSEFLAKHSSEDNESFQKLLEDMQAEHRRRYWWAYEESADSRGQARLLLLPSGERNEGEKMKRMRKAIADGDAGQDRRPSAPQMWKHRARNQLMFPPNLKDSIDTCGRCRSDNDGGPKKMLPPDNPTARGGEEKLRVGDPRGIQHHATRFLPPPPRPSQFQSPSMSASSWPRLTSPLESPGSQRSSILGLESTSAVEGDLERPVPMTPVLVPGAGGESPVMTWGDISGTPLLIDERAIPGATSFRMNDQPGREKLAHLLHHRARTPQRSGSLASVKETAAKSSKQGKAKMGLLTPAAQSLARRLGARGSGGGVLRQPHSGPSSAVCTSSTPFGGRLVQHQNKAPTNRRTSPARRPSTSAQRITDDLM